MRQLFLASMICSTFLFSAFPTTVQAEAILNHVVLDDDDIYDDDDECEPGQMCPYCEDEDVDDSWYDDTAGWPGQREDTWERILEQY